MGRQAQFNEVSLNASERYRHFLETLQNAYNRTILQADLTARSLEAFRKDVGNVQKQYLESEIEYIRDIYTNLNDSIEADTKQVDISSTSDGEWSEFMSENTQYLFEAIKAQTSNDVLFATKFLRSKILQVMTLNSHETAYNLIYDKKHLNFFYTDKIGRKINSVKYIRALFRDYLVKNYNDMIVGTAILNGRSHVLIDNVDKNHDQHGKKIAVTGVDDVNYFDIRDDIFHPNSNSIVRL